jgi:hypothetical protein
MNFIANFIDDKIFKEKSLADYRPSYALSHPHKIMEYVYDEVKKAIQRVQKGWDYTATWGIDTYLARMIPEILDSLKEKLDNPHALVGIPMEFFDVEWKELEKRGRYKFTKEEEENAKNNFRQAIMDISSGFRAYMVIIDEDLYDSKTDKQIREKYHLMKKTFDNGMELFVKYFHTLGD